LSRIVPDSGTLVFVPPMLSLMKTSTVQIPGPGDRQKNCRLLPQAEGIEPLKRVIVDCTSTGTPSGLTGRRAGSGRIVV
jgi:hypothetical protein